MALLKNFILIIIILLIFQSCKQSEQINKTQNNIIEFKKRNIDLEPYFQGFPYNGFFPSYDAEKIFYYRDGEIKSLRSVSLTENIDFSLGTPLLALDFSKRNVWTMKYNPNDNSLYWNGDEINDEVLNLYRLSVDNGIIEKLTDVPYIFGYNWNKDKNKIAYIARLGTKEERLSELRIIDLNNSEETIVLQDIPKMRFSWGNISFSPDNSKLIVPALKDADRNYGNLVLVDLNTSTMNVITDSSKQQRGVSPYSEWLNDEQFLFTSNMSGYMNLYKYDRTNKRTTQLTNFEIDLDNFELINYKEQKLILAVVQNPIENFLYVIDPENGNVLYEKNFDYNITIADSDTNKVIAEINSATLMFQLVELEWNGETINTKILAGVPDDLRNKIINAEVERVEYPTFDIDKNTNKQRMLHGFLFKPTKPLPNEEALVLIQSFYGGSNIFSLRNHLLADAGIYVFSPSPRGSSGFGKEFSALNDKDLGGNEIIDIIYAGKYISELLNIPPERIGVFGGSHGGYATMRLLTFPGDINGNNAQFDWGFGISHAGFSDIIHFYEHCNIPDWVILEAGDPATESEKLLSRSPLYFADNMNARLLLLHGSNDNRVPVEGSRWFADSLAKYNKSYKYVEFEGQGHSIKGLQNNLDFYKTWFEFLEMK